MNYKLVLFVACLTFITLLVASCATTRPISHEEMVANLGPLRKVEDKHSTIKEVVRMLKGANAMPEELNTKLRNHHDIYFAKYFAANNAFAIGDLETYRTFLEEAEKELNSMSKILEDMAKAKTKNLNAPPGLL